MRLEFASHGPSELDATKTMQGQVPRNISQPAVILEEGSRRGVALPFYCRIQVSVASAPRAPRAARV